MKKETVALLREFHEKFDKLNELGKLIEFLASHYKLTEIYAYPATPISEKKLHTYKIKQEPIKIQQWAFTKPEVLEFMGMANTYFDKFTSLLEKFIKEEESPETKLEKLYPLKEQVADLKSYHYPETRFSLVGKIKTKLLLANKEYEDIPIIVTNYSTKPDIVLNEFKLRAEFFYELEIRLKHEINKLNQFLNSDISIVVKNKKAKYLVYELVAVLKHSDYFTIPASEVEKIENRLFTILKIEKPQKRSKEIGYLNDNLDKIRHLRKIVEEYPETKTLK